jgi:glycosyltransferase involved in cell wall biosynthesis
MYQNSKDHILLSTNPRVRALRDLLLNSPQHEFVMLSINSRFKTERHFGRPKMLLYDVPPMRMAWVLYVFFISVLTRPRITICFNAEMTAVGVASAALTRSDVISVIGGKIDYPNKEERIPRFMAAPLNTVISFSLKRASYIFVPNQNVMNSVKKLAGRRRGVSEFKYKISEIFSPAASIETRVLSTSPVILTVGRLSQVKGFEYLVLAAKEVLKVIPEATFVIQSGYPNAGYQDHLERLMVSEGVRDHFRFGIGAIPTNEMPKLYNSADLFVLPSLSEGRSSALLEALACGLPVVATKVGANEEVIEDMKNGFLVEPRDASAMSDRIVKILGDRELWRKLSENARNTSAWSPEHDLGKMLIAATSAIEQRMTGTQKMG